MAVFKSSRTLNGLSEITSSYQQKPVSSSSSVMDGQNKVNATNQKEHEHRDQNQMMQSLTISNDGGDQTLSTYGQRRSGSGRRELVSSSPSPALANNTTTDENNNSVKDNKEQEGQRRGPTSSSDQGEPKTTDPKTERRLAQNREAARKSRLRKKVYVQQLESGKIKLTQIEQELQRARNQSMFVGGDQGLPVANVNSDAAISDMEYAKWQEEHQKVTCDLRQAIEEHVGDDEVRLLVGKCMAHYDCLFNLKSLAAKSDLFHVVSGTWSSPVERCFLWIGGFRPSNLVKVIAGQIEPLTDQQILGICALQQSAQDTEAALSQEVKALKQFLSETITSDSLLICPSNNMGNYVNYQMVLAIDKLSNLEAFVRQADNLRRQTLHRLNQLLTTRQAAKCLLAIAEYFRRLRALSDLWTSRPRQG